MSTNKLMEISSVSELSDSEQLKSSNRFYAEVNGEFCRVPLQFLFNALALYPLITSSVEPTKETVGSKGQLYLCTTYNGSRYTYKMYYCSVVYNGTYNWVCFYDSSKSTELTDEQIATALDAYLKENPIEGTGADGKSAYQIALDNGFEGTEQEWLESLKGAKGDKGDKGDTGLQGKKGEDGKTPVKGVDYFTDADKAEIKADNIDFISSELAKRGQLRPEFASSIEDCTDTSKLYVLPDGCIYAYMSKTGALFTNHLVNAVNTDGTPYNNGLGYKMGYTFDSEGNVNAVDGAIITGYIPYNQEKIFKVCGFTKELNDFDYFFLYDANFAQLVACRGRFSYYVNDYNQTFEMGADIAGVGTFTLNRDTLKAATNWYDADGFGKAKYIRIASRQSISPDKFIVAFNEDIEFGTSYSWQNTGHTFVPADYEDRIIPLEDASENHETRIKTLEMYGTNSVTSEEIPAYIKAEADGVIERAINKQGNRSFNMIAMSDFHYSGTGNNKDNLIRACKAISYIANRIHVDAIATLGDNLPYGSSYDNSLRATADRWCKEINEILAVTQKQGIVDFRTPGNHDRFGTTELYMPDNAIYSFISGYNRQCDYVNAPIGYAYRDFYGHNLRVIVLNTSETEGKGRFENYSGFHMSTKQYNWLIDTLDMSDKPNATEWQVLVISHHKADDYQAPATNSSTNNYILPNILHAYNIGGSYVGVNAEDGKTITCNFEGKNVAKLVGQIHGHHHAYIYGNLLLGNNGTQTNVMAVSTPTSGFGTGEGHNDDNDGNWYDSVKDTASETAFCLYCIDLDNHKIQAIHYGNGIDREIEY